jgi:antitoxin (DNA-binding transcriptional repressor) of toxin-antitoxin stability system
MNIGVRKLTNNTAALVARVRFKICGHIVIVIKDDMAQ